MSQDHNHLNHATWECKYHVVFTPKYRKKLLKYLDKSGGTWALYSATWRGARNAGLKRGI
jgi:REP element-mobilizing transposase RayT